MADGWVEGKFKSAVSRKRARVSYFARPAAWFPNKVARYGEAEPARR